MGEADSMELIYSLIGYPDETEWIEFKSNNNEPDRIGRDISALANAAAYHKRPCAYKIWGVSDDGHKLIGTTFNPHHAKARGNQDLLIWLRSMLSPNASYEFTTIQRDALTFVALTVQAAIGQPVCFDQAAYIREGSSTTRLRPGSAKEAELWKRLQSADFEGRIAEKDVTADEIIGKLDIDGYYSLLGIKKPAALESILLDLCEQELILEQDNGRYSITNLGALLIARHISDYPGLRKRALRIMRYEGRSNYNILDDFTFDKGYALAFPEAQERIMSLVATEEFSDNAFRKIGYAYPPKAVRELLSNAIIHQDLADAATSPTVCIYSNRLEFCNPGASLIRTDRVLNAQPKSRNASLAGMMRLMDLCEEGGTGWDLAVAACEQAHMLPPRIDSSEELGTKVTLFAGSAYDRMKVSERKVATYWHACLMYAQSDAMSNQSLRERFGLASDRKNVVAISRLIKMCCEDNLIKGEDDDASDRYKRYIPFWA